MPANLPPDYHEVERQYREAKTIPEKIKYLQKMLAIIPKHKGTEKLQAEIKSKISKLKKQAQKKKATKRHSNVPVIKREGAAQIVIIGPPNSGKSLFVRNNTQATPEVADYPFTTHTLTCGMMEFENIQFQLIDTPPISKDYMENWLPQIVRYADMALLMIDLIDPDVLENTDIVIERLKKSKIELVRDIKDASKTSSIAKCPTILVGNKFDLPDAPEIAEIIEEVYREKFTIKFISVKTGYNVPELKKFIYKFLNLIRVYTKQPGKAPDLEHPFVLKRGSKVEDLAYEIHKELAKNLKYARIWGSSKFDGQRVTKEYELKEGDIVELH